LQREVGEGRAGGGGVECSLRAMEMVAALSTLGVNDSLVGTGLGVFR